MKKIKFILSLIVMFAFANVSYGQVLAASDHNFTTAANVAAWNTMASNQLCGPCHTPHVAVGTEAAVGAPLWAHSGQLTGAFTPYASTTFQGGAGSPTGISLLCLGCHDGTTNINAHVMGTPGSGTTPTMAAYRATSALGTDLGTSHPISFVYDDALNVTDPGVKAPTSNNSTLPGTPTIDAGYLFGAAGNRTMECASCHDPHGTANNNLLRLSNANSALCLECHIK